MKIEVPKIYQSLYLTKKPIVLLTGGRGSAKSFNTALFTKRLTYERNHKILYTRYTMDSASKSIIPEFKEKIDIENDNKYFKINNTDITNNLTDSMILFSGIKTSSGNQTAKLKSIQGLSTFVVDEAEEWINGDEYETIKLSIRNKKVRNRVIIIMNPSYKNHWVYEKYIQGTSKYIEVEGLQIEISQHPEVEHIHTTYFDNINNLSKEFLIDVEGIKKTDIEKYNHKILGQWKNESEGQIFKNWIKGEFDETLPFGYGLDWGITAPLALVKVAIDAKAKKIYVKQEIYKKGLGTNEIIGLLKAKVGKSVIIADSADKRGVIDLRRANINAIPAFKPQVVSRIRQMMGYELIVCDSPDIENELKNYIWLDKTGDVPIDDFNHALDAIGYYYVFAHRSEF